MKPWKLIALRLLLACLFGGAVTWTALSAGHQQARNSILEYPQQRTRQTLSLIVQAVDAYRERNHTLPRSLSQLKAETGNEDYSQYSDGWGRPFVYTVRGTHYLVASYGRDGRPGGTGWDVDTTSDNPRPPDSGLTFRQFLTNPDTRDMVESACVSGVVAGLLCLVTVRPKTLTWRSAISLTVQVVVTLGAAAWVAMVITALHIPSGH